MNRADVKVERITGSGPGGQHRNKTASCVRLTHEPTGIQVTIDGRNQHANYRKAWKELERRLEAYKQEKDSTLRKERRDEAIKPNVAIRTYDYKKGIVRDHRTKKSASLKDVLVKGKIELLREEE